MPTWMPSAIILALGFAAIVSLYNGQHKIEQANVQNKFAVLELIAMGVFYSNWPKELLIERIANTKSDLSDTKLPSLLEALLSSKGIS